MKQVPTPFLKESIGPAFAPSKERDLLMCPFCTGRYSPDDFKKGNTKHGCCHHNAGPDGEYSRLPSGACMCGRSPATMDDEPPNLLNMRPDWQWWRDSIPTYRLWKDRPMRHDNDAKQDPTVHANMRVGRDPVCSYYSTVMYQSFASTVWNFHVQFS